MVHQETLEFLAGLAANNHKEWFDTNRKAYLAAKEDVLNVVTSLISGIASFDPEVGGLEAKKTVFRIFKDVRFSKDKTPYKTNMGAWIAPGGKGSTSAGYYLHIQPGGNSFVAGGSYMPPSNILRSIRDAIDYDAETLEKILAEPDFVKTFGELEGAKLKTAPRGFAKDHPSIELLRHKSFVVSRKLSDKEMTSPKLVEKAVQHLSHLYPLNSYLNKAIAEASPA